MDPTAICPQSFLYIQARLRLDERGSSLVEYALLLTLLVMVCLLAITYLGNTTASRYSNVASHVISS